VVVGCGFGNTWNCTSRSWITRSVILAVLNRVTGQIGVPVRELWAVLRMAVLNYAIL